MASARRIVLFPLPAGGHRILAQPLLQTLDDRPASSLSLSADACGRDRRLDLGTFQDRQVRDEVLWAFEKCVV